MINLDKAEIAIISTLNDSSLNMPWHVLFYVDLMRIIKYENKITVVTRDAYERYYGMNQARLSKEWLDKYFDTANKYLNDHKKPSSFEVLMGDVGPDGNRVQFSFLSKMFHTLKDDEPIYDGYVRSFLGAGVPNGKTKCDRQVAAVEIYENNIKAGFYKNDKYADFRNIILKRFNVIFFDVIGVSDEKKIDFVLWALGKRGVKITDFLW